MAASDRRPVASSSAAAAEPEVERVSSNERQNWQDIAENSGFDFHTLDGERYWDERAYYAFTLDEIEQQIEAPTNEIDAMCLDLVEHVVDDEFHLRRLAIPENFWPLISESWQRDDASFYGRLDLSFDGTGPAKLLEYNADTPTSIFEASVFQWKWLEDAIAQSAVSSTADQFNSIHEKMIGAWARIADGRHLHLAGNTDSAEDLGAIRYLEDVARQAGLETTLIDIEDIGMSEDGAFTDPDKYEIELLFKLYPWEWIFQEQFAGRIRTGSTFWIEPPWKAILSNKGILPILWEMFPDHPNLLPAFFEDDPRCAELGETYVHKPLHSREGANITLVKSGISLNEPAGPYDSGPFIRQAFAPLPTMSGHHPVIGSWIVDGEACGLSIREDETLITGNLSRFIPHLIGS